MSDIDEQELASKLQQLEDENREVSGDDDDDEDDESDDDKDENSEPEDDQAKIWGWICLYVIYKLG